MCHYLRLFIDSIGSYVLYACTTTMEPSSLSAMSSSTDNDTAMSNDNDRELSIDHDKTASYSLRCLVCDAPTKHAHVGVEICRACAVFYKRSIGRKPYVCRTGSSDCKDRVKCKLCRISQIQKIIDGSKKKASLVPRDRTPPSTVQTQLKIEDDIPIEYGKPTITRMLFSSRPSSCIGLIDRLRFSYNTMCSTRRSAELATMRPDLHPLFTASGELPLSAATLTTTNQCVRILMTSLFEFADLSFPEFRPMTLEHKWFLVHNFLHAFFAFESAYRVSVLFPNHSIMQFTGLLTYMDTDNVTQYLDESTDKNREESTVFLRRYLDNDVKSFRDQVSQARLTEEEFLTVVCLSFWNIECGSHDEFLLNMASKYRQMALNELHDIYKHTQQSAECASRVGELMLIVDTGLRCATAMPWKLEMLRLLNFKSDSNLCIFKNSNPLLKQ